MKDLHAIYQAISGLGPDGGGAALATVVRVRGSAYRREGAKLLVEAGGRMTGIVTGGCLESDLALLAAEAVESRSPRLARYDMTADDDIAWGLGLGCNGTVDVLVEPVCLGLDLHRRVGELLRSRGRAAVATLLPPEVEYRSGGDGPAAPAASPAGHWPAGRPLPRALVFPDGRAEGSLGDPGLDRRVAADARTLLEGGGSGTISYAEGDVYLELVQPPPRVVVFGAGHGAVPVVSLARAVGFEVTVVDGRPKFATAERFPDADEVVLARPEEAGERPPLGPRDYVLVMTHNFLHDLELLARLARAPVPYVGLLGPRVRTEKLLAELERRGEGPDQAALDRLYAPIGLDIGGETAEEIALAALAEIQAVRHGRSGGFLREKKGPIHARS